MQIGTKKTLERGSRGAGAERQRVLDRCSLYRARAIASQAQAGPSTAVASRAHNRSASSSRGWHRYRSHELRDEEPNARHAPAILIIEPDDEFALALEEALEDAQFNVESVASVAEARLLVCDGQFDLVVLDWASDRRVRAEICGFVRNLARRNCSGRPSVIAMALHQSGMVLEQEAQGLEVAALADRSRSMAELVDTVRAVVGIRSDRVG